MPETILVTGATGFVGHSLLEQLNQQGLPVIAWRNTTTQANSSTRQTTPWKQAIRHVEVTWCQVDLLDRNAVTAAIAETNPEVIYHLATVADVGNSWRHASRTLAVNVLGTNNLLAALRSTRVDTKIFIPGSAMIYGQSSEMLSEDAPLNPVSPYAMSKLARTACKRIRYRASSNSPVDPLVRSHRSTPKTILCRLELRPPNRRDRGRTY